MDQLLPRNLGINVEKVVRESNKGIGGDTRRGAQIASVGLHLKRSCNMRCSIILVSMRAC